MMLKSLLILTVLADSAHEPWRTVARPVVFITNTTILTRRAGFSAAGTPEALRTYCKRLIIDENFIMQTFGAKL